MPLESISANSPSIGAVNKDSTPYGNHQSWSGHAKPADKEFPIIGKELPETSVDGSYAFANSPVPQSKTEENKNQDIKRQEKRKGETVSFNNEIAGKKPILCKYYVNSVCTKGNDCPFLHKEFPCKFFHSGRECSKSETCKFSHEPLTDQTQKLLDQFNKNAKIAGAQRFERQSMGFSQGGPPIKRQRMGPPEGMSPYDRMVPYDRMSSYDRMGPYERMASLERMPLYERMSPYDRMSPYERMAPDRMAPHQRMTAPQRMTPFLPSPDGKRSCKFFLEGRCTKGAECTFSHGSSSSEKPLGVCRFFLNGGCNRRNDCPYLHKKLPCKFFNSDITCSKGDSCTYSHEPVNGENQKDGEEDANDTYNHNTSSVKTIGVCRFYLNDACTKGDDCPFLHKRLPCKYYHSGLQCTKGEDCTYSHDPLNPQTKKDLEESLENGKSYGSNRNELYVPHQTRDYRPSHAEVSEHSFGGQQLRPFGSFNDSTYGSQSSRSPSYFSDQYGSGAKSGWKVPERASIPWMRFTK